MSDVSKLLSNTPNVLTEYQKAQSAKWTRAFVERKFLNNLENNKTMMEKIRNMTSDTFSKVTK